MEELKQNLKDSVLKVNNTEHNLANLEEIKKQINNHKADTTFNNVKKVWEPAEGDNISKHLKNREINFSLYSDMEKQNLSKEDQANGYANILTKLTEINKALQTALINTPLKKPTTEAIVFDGWELSLIGLKNLVVPSVADKTEEATKLKHYIQTELGNLKNPILKMEAENKLAYLFNKILPGNEQYRYRILPELFNQLKGSQSDNEIKERLQRKFPIDTQAIELAANLAEWLKNQEANKERIQPLLDRVGKISENPDHLMQIMKSPFMEGNDLWVKLRDEELSKQNLERCEKHEQKMRAIIHRINKGELLVLNHPNPASKTEKAQNTYNKVLDEFKTTEATFIKAIKDAQSNLNLLKNQMAINEYNILEFKSLNNLENAFYSDFNQLESVEGILEKILLMDAGKRHGYYQTICDDTLNNDLRQNAFLEVYNKLKKNKGITKFKKNKEITEAVLEDFTKYPTRAITSIQRLPRHVLLVQEMIKQVSNFEKKDGNLLTLLHRELEFVKYQASQINEAQRNYENYKKAKSLI